MESKGDLICRAPLVLLIACFVAGPLALTAEGASRHQVATASKKCKKKGHRKKHRCKRPLPMQILTPSTPASISISPTSQDFGLQSLGTSTRTFTITNAGGSPSGLPVPSIAGPNAASFTIGGNACANPLPSAVSCQTAIDFRFVGSIGPQSATLNVTAVPGGMVSAAMTGDFED